MNKKAIFYMMMSTIFLAVVILIFVAYQKYSLAEQQEVVESRVRTINDFIKDMEFDAKRAIYVSGYRSLIALEDHVARTGGYLPDVAQTFKQAFYNGTINDTAVDVLKNSTYQDYIAKLAYVGSKIGIKVSANVTNVSLYHDSAWSVNVIVSTRVNVTDEKGTAYWIFDKDYETQVSLEDIRDPVYSVGAYGKVPNTVRKSNITEFISGNDTSALLTHINYSYYVASALAPSFLMRLEGNFSASPYGIESLVYIPELELQEVPYDDEKSLVDYIFFGNVTGYPVTLCDIEAMPEWFKIDQNHSSLYEVDELNYTVCT